MPADAFILDGYVDEPACLGVPPYISPYVRTVAGVLATHGFTVRYLTFDQLRNDPGWIGRLDTAALVVMIAGVTVPGKYLGGRPPTLTEIEQAGHLLSGPEKVIGGPLAFGYSAGGGEPAVRRAIRGFDHLLSGDPAAALDNHLRGTDIPGRSDYRLSDPWAVAGSGIIVQHPFYPRVMCELETARGCPHGATGGCSFCTEPFYGRPRYRSIEGIADEVAALYRHGARHFRVGRQPDLLVYGSGTGEYPPPQPDLLEALFSSIRAAAPDLKTLHIDNTNPATIARFEEESREALRAILRHHTPGDVAAMGMETADPRVVAANNLKASADEVFCAIRVVNEEGGRRKGGIPDLLPGLNFVCGLAGETEGTYALNEEFLVRVRDAGLMLRRVNIRQVMPFEGRPAYTVNTLGRHERRFRAFKEFVRQSIDLPMLRRVFPTGTVLGEIGIEVSGPVSFGRQMGSYPILVGIPLPLPERTVLDAAVVDWGMRSVTALPVPIEINTLPAPALRWLPGIGRKRVAAVLAKRPFKDLEAYRKVVGMSPIDTMLQFVL